MNTKHFTKIILTAIFALVISAVNASAATFTVTTTNDSGAGSLRQAILNANAAAGDDTIAFDSSFNVPRTITVGGTLMTINGSGALTINGPGMNLLTVSGNNASRIFEVSNVSPATLGTVTFNNLTIANGFAALSGDGTGAGIGINNGPQDPGANNVNVVVNNVFFKNNAGGVNPGGGIGCSRSGSITVNSSVFTGNSANGGGAISNGSGIGQCNSVTITNSSFYENQTNTTGATATTITFGGNPGNGIYTISGSSFYNNGNGNGNYTVLMQSFATTSTITNTTFANNRNIGAAVVLSLGTWTMTNVTIANNTAASNNVPAGISLTNGAILNMGNSILARNNSPGGENNFDASGTFVSQGYNIIGNNFTPFVITGVTTGNQLGVNPLVDSTVRDNGGPTPTLALRRNSRAIDAGSPATFPATDQRGIARPQDGNGDSILRSDIGAYERRPTDPTLMAKADFDGDGKSDLSVYRPSEGKWYVLRSTDGYNVTSWGLSNDIVAPGDFDGDGKADFAVFRPSEGFWYIANSGGTFIAGQFGLPGDIPVPADYDGDGKDDRAVFRPSNSTWYILNSNGLNVRTQAFGLAGDRPVPGDYDGDLKADLSVFRPSNGTWYRANSGNGNFVVQQWGLNGDIPVNADYDGDNKQDFAVFRPSTASWYILNSSNGSYNFRSFGLTGDVPVPGDYDGNGSDDIAVFRNGFWYIIRSAQVYSTTQFGLPGDRAIPAK